MQIPIISLPAPAHLEEVNLHRAITKVQDDGTAGTKPGTQVGQPGQLITLPWCDIGPCLQQMFAHVVSEILKEGDLVGESGRESRVRAQPLAHHPLPAAPGHVGQPVLAFFIKEWG